MCTQHLQNLATRSLTNVCISRDKKSIPLFPPFSPRHHRDALVKKLWCCETLTKNTRNTKRRVAVHSKLSHYAFTTNQTGKITETRNLKKWNGNMSDKDETMLEGTFQRDTQHATLHIKNATSHKTKTTKANNRNSLNGMEKGIKHCSHHRLQKILPRRLDSAFPITSFVDSFCCCFSCSGIEATASSRASFEAYGSNRPLGWRCRRDGLS